MSEQQQQHEHMHDGIIGGVEEGQGQGQGPLEVPAFLGMTEQQSRLLVALYNETDPEFAKQMPTALPIAAQQLSSEYEKRNSVGKKVCASSL
jgi:hypothetical protein